MRILMAVDEVCSRTLLADTLTRLGHDPVVAADSKEAIDIYRRTDFSLVISECLMPRISGIELCSLIRAERRQNYTYIMLLTTPEETRHILESLNCGADDFITKPFTEDVLAARIMLSQRIVNAENINRAFARLISICAYCKRVCNDSDSLKTLDESLLTQSDLQLSHGICPGCYQTTVRPELENIRVKRQERADVVSGHTNQF
jgi:sigma-B regulation protein RsbU (phosphoserine phosphatase)